MTGKPLARAPRFLDARRSWIVHPDGSPPRGDLLWYAGLRDQGRFCHGFANQTGVWHLIDPKRKAATVTTPATQVSIDTAIFRQVLGTYPTGVCVISALDSDGKPVGMVVGSFTSVSLDPPLVGFLPDKGSSSWPKIEAAGHFCVNVLASDQQDVCRQVTAKGPEKFVGVDFTISQHNLPIIADAIANIECSIHSVTDAGDHLFVLGNVLGLEHTREGDPMLFYRGRYGGFAELV
jgi:flavin reductase (DIM6/NTAB) family NADH-FMN oxidoreductase RutF